MHSEKTISWDTENTAILCIDQTKLPDKFSMIRCSTVERLITAIRRLEVRGAPALGVAGAFGVALAARKIREKDFERFVARLTIQSEKIKSARPTAVNLAWGVDLTLECALHAISVRDAQRATLDQALSIAASDSRTCHMIGDVGISVLPDQGTVLTHCNAGALACSDWGTALGVIRSGVAAGKKIRVIACETRPLFQGSRLTAWELTRDGIDVDVINDSAAAHIMRTGEIDLVIVGADRITPDVVFNKIGTYMHAVCAARHGIPFYVAAPLSTFDPDHTEVDITIEERAREEISICGKTRVVPDRAGVLNLAFDATPHSLVTGFITEDGVLCPPLDWEGIARKRKIIG